MSMPIYENVLLLTVTYSHASELFNINHNAKFIGHLMKLTQIYSLNKYELLDLPSACFAMNFKVGQNIIL